MWRLFNHHPHYRVGSSDGLQESRSFSREVTKSKLIEMEFIIFSILGSFFVVWVIWKLAQYYLQFESNYPSFQEISKVQEPSVEANKAGDEAAETMTPIEASEAAPSQEDVKEGVVGRVCDSTDSDDSFQIVNRPTEFDLMNETNQDHQTRLIVDQSNRSSFLARFTETLRRRSSAESSRPKDKIQSDPSEGQSESHEPSGDGEPKVVESNEVKGTEEKEVDLISEDQHNKSEIAENEGQKSDAESEGENNNSDAENEGQNKKSEVADSDGDEDSETQKKHAAQKKKEWIRKKIITTAGEDKRTERRTLRKKEKEREGTSCQVDDLPVSRSDDDKERHRDVSEDEWSDDPDDGNHELDLEPDIEMAKKLKAEGNEAFKNEDFVSAIRLYTASLLKCPNDGSDQLISVLLCNRGACHLALKNYESVLADCSDSIEFNDQYVKAYLRRFRANEALEKWHDALADINKAIELDPSLQCLVSTAKAFYGGRKWDSSSRTWKSGTKKITTDRGFGSLLVNLTQQIDHFNPADLLDCIHSLSVYFALLDFR
ncbi:myb-like protein X [Condylostylus longicornis]|uniref:myb-like protein X n=1 Tax=Condylostylus longicornis TaxID=2530218 RepID=UPI00244DDC6C|nr:myb-like protein X [Condylostylus longicornis]